MIVYQCIVDGKEEVIFERDCLIVELFQEFTTISDYDHFARASKDYKDHYIICMHFPYDGRYLHVKSGNELIQNLIDSINERFNPRRNGTTFS